METDELTVKQAAIAFNITEKRIRSAIQRETLPSRLAYDTVRVVKRVDLEAYLKKASVGRPRKKKASPHPDHLQGADNVHGTAEVVGARASEGSGEGSE